MRLRLATLAGRLRAVPRPLVALLGVGLLLSVAWATATAPFQGPDETAHLSYVQNLAENGQKPSYSGGTGTESTELATADYFFGLHPAVGVPYARPMWSAADRRTYEAETKSLAPSGRKNAGGKRTLTASVVAFIVVVGIPWSAAEGRSPPRPRLPVSQDVLGQKASRPICWHGPTPRASP